MLYILSFAHFSASGNAFVKTKFIKLPKNTVSIYSWSHDQANENISQQIKLLYIENKIL